MHLVNTENTMEASVSESMGAIAMVNIWQDRHRGDVRMGSSGSREPVFFKNLF